MSDWLSPNPPRIADPFAVIKTKPYEKHSIYFIYRFNWVQITDQ